MDITFKCWPQLEGLAKRLSSKRFPGLFYYDTGPKGSFGKPCLILLHGLGDEADSWRHIIMPLGEAGYRVLAVDLINFGRSALDMRSSIQANRDAVLELAETVLGPAAQNGAPGGDLVLIGSSMGSAVAEAAVLVSSRVKALILIDGCFPLKTGGKASASEPSDPADHTSSSRTLLAALPIFGKKWYRSFRGDPEKAWRSLFSYYADLESLSKEDRDFLRKRVMDRVCSASQERGYFSSLRSMIFQTLRASYYKQIGDWPGRIALIWGEKDRIIPLFQAESFILQRGANPTEFYSVLGAGHLPHQEKPDETVKAILGFLKTIQ